MGNSLKDQLMGLGYKPLPKAEKPPQPGDRKPQPGDRKPQDGPRKPQDARGRDGRPPRRDERPRGAPPGGKPGGKPGRPAGERRPPRTQEEIDLGKAYALRAQKEKDERIEAERLKQEEARQRREAKAKLAELLKDKALNDPNAEIARHFSYGGKIKRVHVTPEQFKALNAGELGVVQIDGRYLVFPMALVLEAEQVFAPAVALKVDPEAPAGDDPYADPAYQVPDDLVW
jgi:uncharacterized protein YaiL (DUF2058 family)